MQSLGASFTRPGRKHVVQLGDKGPTVAAGFVSALGKRFQGLLDILILDRQFNSNPVKQADFLPLRLLTIGP